jgi:hypothetical protein
MSLTQYDGHDDEELTGSNSNQEYNRIKNYLLCFRSNVNEHRTMAESYFKANSDDIYENLLKISENIDEDTDIRLQAVTMLKKNYKIKFNNEYIKYKNNFIDENMDIDDNRLALPSAKIEVPKENNLLVDSLPYIDQHYKEENRVRDEMNRLINTEMSKFTPKDYLSKFENIDLSGNTFLTAELDRIQAGKKLSVINPDIKINFELPPPNKQNDETYWHNLNNQLDISLQQYNVKNFNLDLLIKYGTPAWKKYLANYEAVISQLKKEKEYLESKNNEINQFRKFKQVSLNI